MALSLASIAIMVGFGMTSSILIIVSIITISLSSVFCFTTYIRMQSRDNIYFDEMDSTTLSKVRVKAYAGRNTVVSGYPLARSQRITNSST